MRKLGPQTNSPSPVEAQVNLEMNRPSDDNKTSYTQLIAEANLPQQPGTTTTAQRIDSLQMLAQ